MNGEPGTIHIRPIHPSELEEAYGLELACYSPEAAATLGAFIFRQRHFPHYFLSAWEGAGLAGLACGIRTGESDCGSDGIKADHPPQPDGRHLCVLSVAVTAGRRREGIGALLMKALIRQASTDGLESVILMCEPHLIRFYERLGFVYLGLSPSGHGGLEWHEMKLALKVAN